MSSRVRVKICGITRLHDAKAAIAAGADALGFVFYAPSPRYITAQAAADIVRQLPPFVTCVGLFVNPRVDEVAQVLATVPLSLLQFHGDETPAFCAQFHTPWIKALAVKPDSDVVAMAAPYAASSGLLLDAWHPDLKGGTGHAFDWSQVPADFAMPIVLAGGLHAGNVAEAVRVVRPYAVDVSGGVETIDANGMPQKGIKDAERMRAFIQQVRRANDV